MKGGAKRYVGSLFLRQRWDYGPLSPPPWTRPCLCFATSFLHIHIAWKSFTTKVNCLNIEFWIGMLSKLLFVLSFRFCYSLICLAARLGVIQQTRAVSVETERRVQLAAGVVGVPALSGVA